MGVANSQTGVNYQLKNSTGNVGLAVAGTGSAITFGLQTAADTYTVIGTNSCGTTAMTGSVIVTVSPQPVSGTLTKGSGVTGTTVCAGTSVAATATAGTGGIGTITDVLQYRYDGIGAWTAYTSGNAITTTAGHTSVDIQTYRTATGSGCNQSTPVVVSWTITPAVTASVSIVSFP